MYLLPPLRLHNLPPSKDEESRQELDLFFNAMPKDAQGVFSGDKIGLLGGRFDCNLHQNLSCCNIWSIQFQRYFLNKVCCPLPCLFARGSIYKSLLLAFSRFNRFQDPSMANTTSSRIDIPHEASHTCRSLPLPSIKGRSPCHYMPFQCAMASHGSR